MNYYKCIGVEHSRAFKVYRLLRLMDNLEFIDCAEHELVDLINAKSIDVVNIQLRRQSNQANGFEVCLNDDYHSQDNVKHNVKQRTVRLIEEAHINGERIFVIQHMDKRVEKVSYEAFLAGLYRGKYQLLSAEFNYNNMGTAPYNWVRYCRCYGDTSGDSIYPKYMRLPGEPEFWFNLADKSKTLRHTLFICKAEHNVNMDTFAKNNFKMGLGAKPDFEFEDRSSAATYGHNEYVWGSYIKIFRPIEAAQSINTNVKAAVLFIRADKILVPENFNDVIKASSSFYPKIQVLDDGYFKGML